MIRTLKSARGGLRSSPAKEPAARTARALARGPADEWFAVSVIAYLLAGGFFAGAAVAVLMEVVK